MKHKRVWSDEQRLAASQRMKNRHEVKKGLDVMPEVPFHDMQTVVAARPAEVQAVIDSMDPVRKAKLAGIQARNLSQLTQTKEGREALERLEERHSGAEQNTVPQVQAEQNIATPEPPKPIVREVPMKVPFRLTGSMSGMMISELGPCVCGESKLKWHPVCLKVRV